MTSTDPIQFFLKLFSFFRKVVTGKASEKIAYSYDTLGRNIEEKRVDSTTANTFDAAGQLLEMKHFKLVLEKNMVIEDKRVRKATKKPQKRAYIQRSNPGSQTVCL